MTVLELRDRLNKLMDDTPNTANDEIYYFINNLDICCIEKIDIKWDIECVSRYICLED